MTIVTIKDWRKVGGCRDAKFWCEEHGVDWRKFVLVGLDVEILKATGDNLSKINRMERAAIERLASGK